MKSDPLGQFRPLDMPRDTRPILNFAGELGAAIDQHLCDAADGRWDQPVDMLIRPKDPEAIAHWVYKSINPLVRGWKRSGIDAEEFFGPFRQTHFELLPEEFTVDSEISMSASGDLMCTPGLEGAKDRLFLNVSDLIFGADISYANLESTLTKGEIRPTEFSDDTPPMINLTPVQYETVASHQGRRFDVLNLANNHILDCGEEGVFTTLDRLQQDGIAQVGVNQTKDDAAKPRITEHAGVRIGWVAHTFSVNFQPFPEDKPWIVNMTPFHLVPCPPSAPMAQI